MAVVTITGTGLNLATAPNNFTITIINYTGGTTQYATNISRATLIAGYNVTVNPGDVTVRATSTGVCGSSATVNVSTLALQSYRPGPIEPTTSFESPESFLAGGGRDGGGGSYEVILGNTMVYPFMSATDFTLTHVSTTGSGLTTGPLLVGTLGNRIEGVDSNILQLIGDSRSIFPGGDMSVNTSIYRVTYTPTGLSRDVNFYWVVE